MTVRTRPRIRRRRLGPVRLLLGALALAVALSAAVVIAFALAFLAGLTLTAAALVCAGVLTVRLTLWSRRRSRARAARHGWPAARERFHRLAAEYGEFECDPRAVARLPALADVSVPQTARFITAFTDAQALHTERRPPARVAVAYEHAVIAAEFAWHEARAEAERRQRPAPALAAALPRWVTDRLYRWVQRQSQAAERSAAHAT
ncbi:MAG TPA: hypothetical protein VFE65_33830 [Pseudonocardia sp.]|nr:hypothetical protein [Pseudonocardia sp.]